MTKRGFAIGNGLSREGYNLDGLRGHGVTVGCNYLYTVWEPDYLVAIDVYMRKEIEELIAYGWPRKWRHICRNHIDGQLMLTIDGLPVKPLCDVNRGRHNNSGVLAAAFLAEVVQVDELYLVGMDFFLDVPGRDNDSFIGNTKQSHTFPLVWNTLTRDHPDIVFYRVGEIAEYDRDFYNDTLKGFRYIETFEESTNIYTQPRGGPQWWVNNLEVRL